MDTGLLIAIAGLAVAGIAAVVGIWMERDKARPPRWAYSLSILITLATLVSIYQSYEDSQASKKMEDDMARMLQQLEKLASTSPEAKAMLESELQAQARSNPDVVRSLAKRVEAEGGDPAAMLAKHLPASEVTAMANNINAAGTKDAEKKKALLDLQQAKADLEEAKKKAAEEAKEKEKIATNLEEEKKAAEERREELLEIAQKIEKGDIKELRGKLLNVATKKKPSASKLALGKKKKPEGDAEAGGADSAAEGAADGEQPAEGGGDKVEVAEAKVPAPAKAPLPAPKAPAPKGKGAKVKK